MYSIKFSFPVVKNVAYMENLEFSAGLKFHLNLVYQVEIFTCNCNVILKSSLLFSRAKISTQYNELIPTRVENLHMEVLALKLCS